MQGKLFLYICFAQVSPKVSRVHIHQDQAWKNYPGQSSDFLHVYQRENHSGGASIECNFTAETHELFIFFTMRRESRRFKLGYLILTLVKP